MKVSSGEGDSQGDPLSPYLFICVVEAFIALLARAKEMGQSHGVKVAPSAPSISTLCFADDTMIFCRANAEEAGVLKHLIDLYATASGQVVNFEKSSMTFSNGVRQGMKTQIAAILGVHIVDSHDRYLGMPAVVEWSKREIFSFFPEWSLETHSRMGRTDTLECWEGSINKGGASINPDLYYELLSASELHHKIYRSGDSGILVGGWHREEDVFVGLGEVMSNKGEGRTQLSQPPSI